MEEKFQKGMFGRFAWKIKKRINGELCDMGYNIEGAMIKDMDKNYLWLLGTDGQVYVAPKKAVTFEPMCVPDLYEITIKE